MDRMLYVAMSGARQIEDALAVTTHNLANVTTPGFKGELAAITPVPVQGPGFPTRIYSQMVAVGTDLSVGPTMSTGLALDIAVKGEGWIAVQAADGTEGYTRRGDLRIGVNGILENGAGQVVLGNGGPIAIPEWEKLDIGGDGTISIRPRGQTASALAVVDRIKLVNPEPAGLRRGEDGLLQLRGGAAAEPDASVQIVSGVLENSNVNAVAALVNMIELSRSYEMQVKLMRDASENEMSSSQMMRMS